jgi:alpha-galactosidase
MVINLISFSFILLLAFSLDNGLGKTPPMGWNSWNHFGCNISEQVIKETADLLVSTGLAAKGYKYLNIDDCWQVFSLFIVDFKRFPNKRDSIR